MESPLAGAVESGNVSQVIQLLNEGVDVNSPTGLNGESALMLAAYTGNIEILTLLLSSPNIDINFQDLSGQTALTIAAYQVTLSHWGTGCSGAHAHLLTGMTTLQPTTQRRCFFLWSDNLGGA